MKNFKALIIAVLIIACGMLATSCKSSIKTDTAESLKKLTDCLNLTKGVNSVEAEAVSISKGGGQSVDLKMNMKAEDIKSNLKCMVTMDLAGEHQEFYLGIVNGEASIYMKDDSGKYTVNSADSSELGEMDIMRSFSAYIEIIEKNPEMISKTEDNKYELKIPEEKSTEIYSKITGKDSAYKFESLMVDFVIGEDGYLKNVIVKASTSSLNLEIDTKYFNYNKKFNIKLPEVS